MRFGAASTFIGLTTEFSMELSLHYGCDIYENTWTQECRG